MEVEEAERVSTYGLYFTSPQQSSEFRVHAGHQRWLAASIRNSSPLAVRRPLPLLDAVNVSPRTRLEIFRQLLLDVHDMCMCHGSCQVNTFYCHRYERYFTLWIDVFSWYLIRTLR